MCIVGHKYTGVAGHRAHPGWRAWSSSVQVPHPVLTELNLDMHHYTQRIYFWNLVLMLTDGIFYMFYKALNIFKALSYGFLHKLCIWLNIGKHVGLDKGTHGYLRSGSQARGTGRK